MQLMRIYVWKGQCQGGVHGRPAHSARNRNPQPVARNPANVTPVSSGPPPGITILSCNTPLHTADKIDPVDIEHQKPWRRPLPSS